MDLKALKNYGTAFLRDCRDLHENWNSTDSKRTEQVQSVALRAFSALAVVGAVAGIAATVATFASPVLPSVISLLALGCLGAVARDMFVIGHNALHESGASLNVFSSFQNFLNSFRGKNPLYKNIWVGVPFPSSLVQGFQRSMMVT